MSISKQPNSLVKCIHRHYLIHNCHFCVLSNTARQNSQNWCSTSMALDEQFGHNTPTLWIMKEQKQTVEVIPLLSPSVSMLTARTYASWLGQGVAMRNVCSRCNGKLQWWRCPLPSSFCYMADSNSESDITTPVSLVLGVSREEVRSAFSLSLLLPVIADPVFRSWQWC